MLEAYNINLDDALCTYLEDCDWRFNKSSTREITKYQSDLWLKNHTRIQYHFSGILMDELWYKLYTVSHMEKGSRII